MLGCNAANHTPIPDNLCYYKFTHVKEIYDSQDPEHFLSYRYDNMKLSKVEMDTLVAILEELNVEYLVTDGGDVLIKKTDIEDADGKADGQMFYYIDGLLIRRTGMH
ncbi:hypothetical protein CLV59_109230 [Chitinophaga dinghuensis]|uniref:Uncharacterized protein n=2 Tax=Chitinophaga dinghuensis TaxID=1539050 RepID=A0A327VPC0_9BACT|nr:hypothetical protein CLV59_109230 [Chitinophaga dinghuensis]